MTAPIVLTAHQTEAVQFLTDHLHDGDPIVALRGLAGTGKTSLIPTLIDVLEGTGIDVTLGAPTHRAAMVLKKKGLEQADTVHAHALVPYFTGDYTKAVRWLGGSCQCKVDELANAHPPVDGLPWLVHARLQITRHPPEVVKTRARQHDPKKALESIGIYGRNHFHGFGPKEGTGVLIIDEASMVGEEMLRLCQDAYPQLCLIGDPGQLPPVKDAAVLATVPGFDLVEIHRQAADSPIVQLAYAARNGERFWERMQQVPCELEEYSSVEALQFLTAPLVVWRNKTRLECTTRIREALGFQADRLALGEPLVCRSTDPRARADGFYNNALFRVTALHPDNPRMVTVQPDGRDDAEEHEVLIHMEESHGENIDPDAILFRYGYCLTAHTAQGGEWPIVYISKPDLFAHTKRSPEPGEEDSFKQWAYTAITRAKATLGFVTKHDFGGTALVVRPTWILPPGPGTEGADMPRMQQQPKVAPPSAPMLTNYGPEPDDDITDPPVPEGVADEAMAQAVPGLAPAQEKAVQAAVNGTPPETLPARVEPLWAQHEALLHGFCGALQGQMSRMFTDEVIRLTKGVNEVTDRLFDYMKGKLEGSEHAAYQFSDALLKVQDKGLTVHGSPYEMTLQVYTPAGVPLTLTVRQTSPAALLDELTQLETWLAMNGYTGEKPAPVAA